MALDTSESYMVNQLMDGYSRGVIPRDVVYDRAYLSRAVDTALNNHGFMGSANVVFMTSKGSITHEAPACIAASLVNMVAKKTISLGMEGQGLQPFSVRIYAPLQLSITTKHLSVGDIKFLVEPSVALIACEKLTLSTSKGEEPEYFEIVRNWVINDSAEVEKVLR